MAGSRQRALSGARRRRRRADHVRRPARRTRSRGARGGAHDTRPIALEILRLRARLDFGEDQRDVYRVWVAGRVRNISPRFAAENHLENTGVVVLSGYFATFVLPPDCEPTPEMHAGALSALAQMDATALADRYLAELSTGEARRVLIARALVHRPRALLLDEPTTGLDLVSQQHFLNLLRDLARQGVTLVLATHHIEEIIPEISRVVLLRGGRVVADGSREDTLTAENLSLAYGGPLRVRREEDRFYAHY